FPGYFSSALVPGNYIAVSAACLLVRGSMFSEVGGLSPMSPYRLNDVDFCLKLRHAGLRNVYSPGAELYHYEASDGAAPTQPELDLLRSRWGSVLHADPYHNPNLRSENYP